MQVSAGQHASRHWHWSIPIVALLTCASYVAWTQSTGLLGFPLDDAWIHETYARNLAATGQLSYLPGQPSAGSTSPAWSFLLSVGYLIGIDPVLWAYLLGALALAATALLIFRLSLRLSPSRTAAALIAGLLCACEWHLVWAATSGMETMLFTALSLGLLEYFLIQASAASERENAGPVSLRHEQTIVRAAGIGLLGGLLTLTRPEGLGLAGLVIAAGAVSPLPQNRPVMRTRLLATGASLVSLVVILAPYVAFNLSTSGSFFPNTFYAKQAEYHIRAQVLSFPLHFWQVLSPTLAGAQALLVPDFAMPPTASFATDVGLSFCLWFGGWLCSLSTPCACLWPINTAATACRPSPYSYCTASGAPQMSCNHAPASW
jgi:hypothetical protein